MDSSLLEIIQQQNPWLSAASAPIIGRERYIPRLQSNFLLQPAWDAVWTLLVAPRQAGKTTLGKHLCEKLIQEKRYSQLLYLNCDYYDIRRWLDNASFIADIHQTLSLKNYILFID